MRADARIPLSPFSASLRGWCGVAAQTLRRRLLQLLPRHLRLGIHPQRWRGTLLEEQRLHATPLTVRETRDKFRVLPSCVGHADAPHRVARDEVKENARRGGGVGQRGVVPRTGAQHYWLPGSRCARTPFLENSSSSVCEAREGRRRRNEERGRIKSEERGKKGPYAESSADGGQGRRGNKKHRS